MPYTHPSTPLTSTNPIPTQVTTTETGSKRASFTAATFDNTADFFTRLCEETTALAFDISELANGSVTRLVRTVCMHACTLLLYGACNGIWMLHTRWCAFFRIF